MDLIPVDVQSELVYNICGMVVLSCIRFANHLRLHENRQSKVNYVDVLPDRPAEQLFQFSGKICWSDAGLKQHMRVHKENVTFKTP